MLLPWPCPVTDPAPGTAGTDQGHAWGFDRNRAIRLLISPPLFDEANRLRRFVAQTMRQLDAAGIDVILPDLPGTLESRQRLQDQSLAAWRTALAAAETHFGITHVLAVRGGALLTASTTAIHYAPVSGASLLRQMLRMRILSAREAGQEENQADLLAAGAAHGLDLGGYPLGPAMIRDLHEAPTPAAAHTISQADIGGPGLWLRAEPGEDEAQSATLARCVAATVGLDR